MDKPKKLYIYIIITIIFISFCFSTIVNAENGIMPLDTTTTEGIINRIVDVGYISEFDWYEITYRVYNETGLKEGTLRMIPDFYNRPSWFLVVNNDGTVSYYTARER